MNPTLTPLTSTAPADDDAAGIRSAAEVAHLYRVRHGVRAVLALGVAASVAGNVLHAQPSLVGRAIAAWSPLALLLTVELISRVPVHRPALSAVRMLSTAAIAGIAAWVSYGHMVSVALRHGEQPASAHLLPLSVDGLVVVASISLVEIAARLTHTHRGAVDIAGPIAAPVPEPERKPMPEPEPEPEPEAVPEPVPEPDPEPEPEAKPEPEPVVRRTRARGAKPVPTGVKVARLRERYPQWTVAQIADRAGVSERTARRYLNTAPTPEPATDPVTDPGVTGPETSGPVESTADGVSAADVAA
jgi:hypothetical protein